MSSKPTKDELIEAVDAIAEHSYNVESRLRVVEERLHTVRTMLDKIDHMIVRMNGPSTPYRDELREIAIEFGFPFPADPTPDEHPDQVR